MRNISIKDDNIVDDVAQQEHDNITCYTLTINIDDMVMKFGVDNYLMHLKLNVWLTIWPEKVIGLTRNTNPYGTTMVDPSTLQAAAHAASNACINCYMDKLKNIN